MILDKDSEQLQQIIELKKENAKMRLSYDNFRNIIAQKDIETQSFNKMMRQNKLKENRLNEELQNICFLLKIEYKEDDDPFKKLQSIQHSIKKIIRQKEQQRFQVSQTKEIHEDMFHDIEKQKQIKSLNKQIRKLEQENKIMEIQLGEYANKVSSLQIQLKQLHLSFNESNDNGRSDKLKRQCYELMKTVSIKNDDYIKSYLLKNNTYQNGYTNISRKNKHNLIFQ